MDKKVMPIYHNREQMIADIRTYPESMFVDGVLTDVPKRRRREQAMGTRKMVITWPKELKKRFGTQYNRYVELLGKDLGLHIMLRFIERPSDEDLKALLNVGA